MVPKRLGHFSQVVKRGELSARRGDPASYNHPRARISGGPKMTVSEGALILVRINKVFLAGGLFAVCGNGFEGERFLEGDFGGVV